MNYPALRPGFRLSKSSYLNGRQCPLRLWLYSRDVPESSPDEETQDSVDDFADQARLTERAAEQRFPDGVTVAPTHRDTSTPSAEPIDSTARAMADPSVAALFQAQFETDSKIGITDILARSGAGWILYEVKASSSIKPIFIWDLAFQWLLLEDCGHQVAAARVLHLNKEYVYAGREVDTQRLFVEVGCTEQVKAVLEEVRQEIRQLLDLLAAQETPVEPPGRRCDGNRSDKAGRRPSDCGHLSPDGFCGKHLPPNWSLRLPNMTGEAKMRHITLPGNDRIENLNPKDARIDWSPVQARVIRSVKSGEPQVDKSRLREDLGNLQWPLTFVDFEFEPALAVPPFAGMRPNQKLPFQWSAQVQSDPKAELVCLPPFLHVTRDDPREGFIQSLLKEIPPTGSIVVHSRQAESSVLGLYEEWCHGRYWPDCQKLVSRFVDTFDLAKQSYYHPNMDCSFSIKKLAPALIDQGYDQLAIQDGMAAVRQWRQLIDDGTSAEEKAQIENDLRAYCNQDTLLMHGIVTRFRELTR